MPELCRWKNFCRVSFLLPIQMALIISLGIFGKLNLEEIVRSQIYSELVVNRDGALYPLWSEPPIHPILKVYVFNVTNKDEWLEGGGKVKLKLEEVGPLVYKETWWKTNVEFSPDGDVSYDLIKKFQPLPELSGCDARAKITVPNIPLFSGAAKMKDENTMTQWAFQTALEVMQSELFVTVPMEDLLWGYQDPLLLGAAMVLPAEEIRKPGHFGLLAGRNLSSDGRYSIRGGFGPEGIQSLGSVTAWKGRQFFNTWKSADCDKVAGGEGSQFPPKLSPHDNIELFVPDMCRSISLEYKTTDKVAGVETFRFEPVDDLFDYKAEKNKCYCLPPANCSGQGVFYVAPCKFGAPLVVSWPHLLDSPDNADRIDGLNPREVKHRFSMQIQPTLGMGLSAKVRLQLNLDLIKPPGMEFFSKVPVDRLLIPIMWFENTIDEPPVNLMIILRDALSLPGHVATSFLIVCSMIVAVQLFLIAFCRCTTIGQKTSAGGLS